MPNQLANKFESLSQIHEYCHAVINEKHLDEIYSKRLDFEIQEISKQGADTYWLNILNSGKRFSANPKYLLLPWLLDILDDCDDPIASRPDTMLCTTKYSAIRDYINEHGKLPCGIIKDMDLPDIDIDCIPMARDPIKEYAISKYSIDTGDIYGSVCSVGTWQTYKLRSAIIDVSAATEQCTKNDVYALTTQLPDEVDELKDNGMSVCRGKTTINGEEKECKFQHDGEKCPKCGNEETEGPTIGKLLKEYAILSDFRNKYPDVIRCAVRLVGRIKNMGMHAGAIIITDRPLYGNVPLAKRKQDGQWVSLWTEGRSTQLSKFGYVKWDILGLKTLEYTFNCCKLIEQNRGISFGHNMSGWDDIDPLQNRAGHYFINGEKHYIELNDAGVLQLANDIKTDAVFQFDTDLAKSILANHVRNFDDLMLFNAMGHPGPMASIPEAVKNRDDVRGSWKKRLHPKILPTLESTYGTICFQEQLQALWQLIAGFTAPEAQEARKAVAKKWRHKLKPIRDKWIVGASRLLGVEAAKEWWDKMESFGRYAFNKSHAVSYCLVAHRCLWFKAHFPAEWWASVMSGCHPDKLVRYMDVARSEGVRFDSLNANNLSVRFTVTGDMVNPGLIGVKKVGKKQSAIFAGIGEYKNIDEFVLAKGKQKTVMERLIKLGAFKSFPGHENILATWKWYQYAYCASVGEAGKEVAQLRKDVRAQLLAKLKWSDEAIRAEKARQIAEYRRVYPKRQKIPAKIVNWKPSIDDSREEVMALFPYDFTLPELLAFEKEYLGYYLHSPMDMYKTRGITIKSAKNAAEESNEVTVEGYVVSINYAMTKPRTDPRTGKLVEGSEYARLIISDGIDTALIFIWNNDLIKINRDIFVAGTGLRMIVNYDEQRGSFTLSRGREPKILAKK